MAKVAFAYLGGKTRAATRIASLIPAGLLVSPFLGGGAVELTVAGRGDRVAGFDAHLPVATFWQWQLYDPEALSVAVARTFASVPTSTEFEAMKRAMAEMDFSVELAAAFYVVQRLSAYGMGVNGGFWAGSRERFGPGTYERIRTFKMPSLSVGHSDFRETLARFPEHFAYLDPPYRLARKGGEKLYGFCGELHRNFPHFELFELLKDRPNWLMSYGDVDEIAWLYEGFPIRKLSWDYTAAGNGTRREGKELLIASRNLRSLLEG